MSVSLFECKLSGTIVFCISENPLQDFLSSHFKGKRSSNHRERAKRRPVPSWLLTSLKHIKSSVTRRSIPTESVDASAGEDAVGACICITLWWTIYASVKVHRLRSGRINLCPVNHNKTQMRNFKPECIG